MSELLDDLFQNSNIVPTVGFNVEKFKSKSGQCLVEIKMFVLTPLTDSSLHFVTIAPAPTPVPAPGYYRPPSPPPPPRHSPYRSQVTQQ